MNLIVYWSCVDKAQSQDFDNLDAVLQEVIVTHIQAACYIIG